MIHVLVVGMTSRRGGVESFIRNIVLNSDKERVRFDFLIHDLGSWNKLEQDIVDFYGEKEPSRFFRVQPIKKNPLKCFAQLLRLRHNMLNKYDYIHLHTGAPSEVIYCLPLTLFSRTRLIAHSHSGGGVRGVPYRISRWVLNHVVDIRLACSDSAAEWLFGFKYARDCVIINNGVDLGHFAFSGSKRIELRKALGVSDAFLVGHVGRFRYEKNHFFIIDVFSQLLKNKPESVLCLVGDGELFESVRDRVKECDLTKKVLFLGLREDVNELMSAFDVLIFPSLYEGLPLTLVEAQASGLPALISDNITEEVKVTDLVFSMSLSRPASEWARVLESVHGANRLSYVGQVRSAGFDLLETAKQLQDIYDEAMVSQVGQCSTP